MAQPLRFGTYTEIQGPPGRNHAELIWDIVALAEHSDQSGFAVFCTLEHPFFEQFAINPNPLALFCTIAQRTRNLRFRALCHTLPLHNPMVLAGEIAEADILTNGRLEVGVGRGHAWLNEPANIVLEENQERYVEALDILIKAWTEERFSYAVQILPGEGPLGCSSANPEAVSPNFPSGDQCKMVQTSSGERVGRVCRWPSTKLCVCRPSADILGCVQNRGHRAELGVDYEAIYLDEDEATARREAEPAVPEFCRFQCFADGFARADYCRGKEAFGRRRLCVLRGGRFSSSADPVVRTIA